MTQREARRLNALAEQLRAIDECDGGPLIRTTLSRLWGNPAIEMAWLLRDRAFTVAVALEGELRVAYRIGRHGRVCYLPRRNPFNALRDGHAWLRSGDGLDSVPAGAIEDPS